MARDRQAMMIFALCFPRSLYRQSGKSLAFFGQSKVSKALINQFENIFLIGEEVSSSHSFHKLSAFLTEQPGELLALFRQSKGEWEFKKFPLFTFASL